jgi:putative membrane protein
VNEPIRFATHPIGSDVGLVSSAVSLDELCRWSWRPEVVLICVLAGSLYAIGWQRLSRRCRCPLRVWRLASALGGLTSIAFALLSPLAVLSEILFAAHMLQHMLLLLGAPAVLLADPLPIMLWALPRTMRRQISGLLAPGAALRRVWWALTWMPSAWLSYTITLWVWHLPAAYEGALDHPFLHDIEHLAFFAASVVFWWPVINPAPHVRRAPARALSILYLVLAAFQKAGLALLLMLSSRLLYPSYAGMPRLLDLSPLEDQVWGGVIMWGVGGALDMAAVLVLLFHFLALEERPRHEPAHAGRDGPTE